jgi:hypothetical protein
MSRRILPYVLYTYLFTTRQNSIIIDNKSADSNAQRKGKKGRKPLRQHSKPGAIIGQAALISTIRIAMKETGEGS